MKKTMLFIGSVIILIFSAITFIFIPAMADTMSQKALVFGKYGNKKIEYKQGTEFANAVSNYTEMYRNQGANLTESAYFYIFNYAFNSAVQAVAYAESVKKSGYEPSEETVARAMYPYFTDETGNYSKEIFNSYSQADKTNLKTQLTKGFVWNRYSEDLLGSQNGVAGHKMFGLKTADAEVDFLAKMGSDKRSFQMAVFNKADYPESEIKKFGEENKDKFSKYNLSIISVKESSEAKKILNQLKNEEITFADAINEYSDKAYTGSDGLITANLGYQIKAIMKDDAEFEKVASLAADELSEIAETTVGYAIFRCNTAKTEADFANKDTLSAVKDYIEEHEISKIEDFYIARADSLIEDAAKTTFADACKKAGCKSVSVPAFALNYDNSSMFDPIPADIPELNTASMSENFLEKAFALNDGDVSSPIVLDDSVVVLKSTGSQTIAVSEERKDEIRNKIGDFDSNASQLALTTDKKVVNNVAEVFFKNFTESN